MTTKQIGNIGEIYPCLDTVYFRADNFTSSSFVRELIKYGKDVSKYLP